MSSNDSSLNDLPLRTIEQIFRNMNLDLDVTFPINNFSHEIRQHLSSNQVNDYDLLSNLMRIRNRENLQYIINELNSSSTNSINIRGNPHILREITDSDEDSDLETLDSHSDGINIEDEIVDTKNEIIVPKCSVCYENNSIIMFIGCGHVCSCNECSNRLSNCPICRMRINGRQRIFFS